MNTKQLINTFLATICCVANIEAQTFTRYTTTEQQAWQQSRVSASRKALATPALEVAEDATGHEFRAWGTCFNELDLDALEMLPSDVQEKIMKGIFAPNGDLRFTRGRLTMNANDYSRAWYSCDTVAGDFGLKHFNIEHDKQNVIRLIRMAQKHYPGMTFWMSPWSPPTWMKINQDYPVVSSKWNTQAKEKDYLLFDNGGIIDEDEMKFAGTQRGKFPRQLASQTYMIQDPRYLQAYANMFGRFIDLYRAEGIPVDMVMYQNEAYSYTPYPGCAWTAEGTVLFNKKYLVPTLKKTHPDVDVFIGTFNTNRLDYVETIVDQLKDDVSGIGLQWEGRENLDALRKRYPHLRLMQTESECGRGHFDWRSGEHTFYLLHENVGRGCDEYYIWNFILADRGTSPWGWNQNALIHVDSQTGTHRLTAEYYAVKHFSHFVTPGSRMVGFKPWRKEDSMQAIVFRTPEGKHVVVAGNTADQAQSLTVKIGKRHLNVELPPHSFNTFIQR